MSAAPFPRKSSRVGKKEMSFGNSMGAEVDPRNWDGIPLLEAPVARLEENDFLVNQYGKDIQEAQGDVSLEFARRVLGREASVGDELVVRMIKHGEDPRHDEVYTASLQVESDPYPDEMDASYKHPMMLREIPEGMSYGDRYDFIVDHTGADYVVVEDEPGEGLDSVVDLDEMR